MPVVKAGPETLRVARMADEAVGFRVESRLVYAHGIAALVTLLVAAILGIVISLQFLLPDLTGGIMPLGWGPLHPYARHHVLLATRCWPGNVSSQASFS